MSPATAKMEFVKQVRDSRSRKRMKKGDVAEKLRVPIKKINELDHLCPGLSRGQLIKLVKILDLNRRYEGYLINLIDEFCPPPKPRRVKVHLKIVCRKIQYH